MIWRAPLIVFNLLTTVQAWFIVISIAKTQSFEGGIHCFWVEEKVLKSLVSVSSPVLILRGNVLNPEVLLVSLVIYSILLALCWGFVL